MTALFFLWCLQFMIWPVFGANILVAFPHTYFSHFKQTSKLVIELEARGHNVTFISPFPQDLKNTSITQISIASIIEPIEGALNDFYEKTNFVDSYFSRLRFEEIIGYEYSRLIFENQNFQQLLRSNSSFDLIIMESFPSDSLAILSHIYKAPLIVLLSEPVTTFYEEYLIDSTNYDGIMNSLWKCLFFDWFIYSKLDKLIAQMIPRAVPDLKSLLYNTRLVLMPGYSTMGHLVPRYENVKHIGGFHMEINKSTIHSTSTNKIFMVSSNLPENSLELLNSTSVNISSDVSLKIDDPDILAIVLDGDVYDLSLAVTNNKLVFFYEKNQWFQYFLARDFLEQGFFVDSLEIDVMKAKKISEAIFRIKHLLSHNAGRPAMEEAMFWIDYVLNFPQANVKNDIQSHLIIIIIVLILAEFALFIIFYWIFTHLFPILICLLWFILVKCYRKLNPKNYDEMEIPLTQKFKIELS